MTRILADTIRASTGIRIAIAEALNDLHECYGKGDMTFITHRATGSYDSSDGFYDVRIGKGIIKSIFFTVKRHKTDPNKLIVRMYGRQRTITVY